MSAIPTRERLAARVRALEARHAMADGVTRERVARLLAAARDDLERWGPERCPVCGAPRDAEGCTVELSHDYD